MLVEGENPRGYRKLTDIIQPHFYSRKRGAYGFVVSLYNASPPVRRLHKQPFRNSARANGGVG